jgi:hypothetical protein
MLRQPFWLSSNLASLHIDFILSFNPISLNFTKSLFSASSRNSLKMNGGGGELHTENNKTVLHTSPPPLTQKDHWLWCHSINRSVDGSLPLLQKKDPHPSASYLCFGLNWQLFGFISSFNPISQFVIYEALWKWMEGEASSIPKTINQCLIL